MNIDIIEKLTADQKKVLAEMLSQGYTYDEHLSSFFGDPTMSKGAIYYIFDLNSGGVAKHVDHSLTNVDIRQSDNPTDPAI